MPEVKERQEEVMALAEKLEAEATRMGQEDMRTAGQPRDTSCFYLALARVALEFCEGRRKINFKKVDARLPKGAELEVDKEL